MTEPRAAALLARWVQTADFLVAARVASTIGYFARLLPALARSPARAVWVSSDANPYAVALTEAARHLGRATCFVTHGHVAEGPAPLRFDLSVLDGAVVRDVYARSGPIEGEVVLRGVEGESRPMSTAGLRRGVRCLGVFTSILVDWPRVARAVSMLRETFRPEKVLLRLHPNREMRDPQWARALDLDGVVVSEGERPIARDSEDCDLVACGNTSAQLSVLKQGVPSVYVPDLDSLDDDYYRFVALGVAPRLAPDTTCASIAAFFESPDWADRFARLDAAYLDRRAACDAAVARALVRLVERP